MTSVPHELAAGDVYLSPLLPVAAVALLGAWLTSIILNKSGLARYIVFPTATFLSMIVLYVLLLDAFWIKI